MSFFKKITQEFENLGFGDKKKEEGAPQQAQDSKLRVRQVPLFRWLTF